MEISKNEIINFYENIWDKEDSIKDIREAIKGEYEIFAEETQVSEKILKKGYSIYKMHRNGKVIDDDAYYEIVAAIEEEFAEG